jgi:hypothetical protein
MVDMQMRAQHDVDVLRLDAGRQRAVRAKAIWRGEIPAAPAPPCRCRNRIDQDRQPVLANEKALDGDGEKTARRILQARLQPCAVGIEVRLACSR